MGKEKDTKQKQIKKAPAKNLKEKRAAKVAKRAEKQRNQIQIVCDPFLKNVNESINTNVKAPAEL